jgi:hypothetical protein
MHKYPFLYSLFRISLNLVLLKFVKKKKLPHIFMLRNLISFFSAFISKQILEKNNTRSG